MLTARAEKYATRRIPPNPFALVSERRHYCTQRMPVLTASEEFMRRVA